MSARTHGIYDQHTDSILQTQIQNVARNTGITVRGPPEKFIKCEGGMFDPIMREFFFEDEEGRAVGMLIERQDAKKTKK